MAPPAMDDTPSAAQIGSAQQELSGAIEMMKGNMAMMVERESGLVNLEAKSGELHGSADKFKRQAKRLQWEMRWRKIRLALLLAALCVFAVLFVVFRHQWKMYLVISAVVFAALYVVQYCLNRHWERQFMDSEERTSLASGPLD
eukprot:TRINITY_DN24632_c0_g1_i2.p2 TRINITY_DN24632_c0_g1~~TRINITY_DN24632_c0_g1_i2.p2  ORF type:complete len:144 (+),score=29.71 TRINITY_DN24632_c0_g1_i2:111-542(+)